jgi:hypothetical protein
MKNLFWKLLGSIYESWGYSTPTQERFKAGQIVCVSANKEKNTPFIVGEHVTVIETGRHDYLVRNSSDAIYVVYQFELDKI